MIRTMVLLFQAKDIRNLYAGFITTFNKAADAWVTYVKSLLATSHDQCTGPTYTALVQLGKSSVPLVMVRYAGDHTGYWGSTLR